MWFARKLRLPAPAPDAPGGTGSVMPGAALVRYLAGQLAEGEARERLKPRVERFAVLPPDRQDAELSALYLGLEDALAAGAGGVATARPVLRRFIATHFAALLDRPDFALIFAPPREQEFLLCRQVLASVTAHGLALLGTGGRDRLGALAAWLKAAPEVALPVPFVEANALPRHHSEWVALLFRLARNLYVYLEHRLGQQCARSFFERGYEAASSRYLGLDTFPVVISLLPERLIDSEKIGRLSRSQIQNVLLQKLDEVNAINGELRHNYDALEAARAELVAAQFRLEERVRERTAELERTNDQLKQEIVERTRIERDLRDSKEQAEQGSRAKSQFLANMSHELRTPLNAVIGFADLMRQQVLGPEQNPQYHEYHQAIHDSASHLLSLINDILDLSKAEAGKLDLVEEVIDLRPIVDQVFRLVAGDKKTPVALDNRVPAELPPIHADSRRMTQVLVNLVSNAVKFTPTGSVTVTADRDAAGGIVIRVADTGIGIALDDLDRVQKPFEQAEGGYARQYQGTGLGLPLAKKLVELHDGVLSIDSTPGKGTTVAVSLPAERVMPGHADPVLPATVA